MNYIKAIDDLNKELLSKQINSKNTVFSYSTNGFVHSIFIDELMIWHSEKDTYKGEDNEESFKEFIKKLFNEKIDKFEKLRI